MSAPSPRHSDGPLGHPAGLLTLFFTEMWERFSYYGMRALLMLFMVAEAARGGLGLDVKRAAMIYGLYTSMVYFMAIPGGLAADRFLGPRRAVFLGGILIALGHFCLVFHALPTFFGGLILIVAGTGLLKPNISVLVGQLYRPGDARRDAGFSIFYMGINLGATISPIICGWLGQTIGWHWGFAAAGVGMSFGVAQFWLGQRRSLGAAAPGRPDLASGSSTFREDPPSGTFRKPLASAFTPSEWKRVAAIGVLFIFSCVFWTAFEQAGSSFNLFADQKTRTAILGRSFPSSWLQAVGPALIILLAPVFAWLWLKLGPREPSSPAKFALGLLFVGIGPLLLAIASLLSGGADVRVSPVWLVLVYLAQTIGELCLSPVGLSTVTKLAPPRIVGLMMGVWFLSLSVGNYAAGWVAGFFGSLPLPQLFGSLFLATALSAFILALLIRPLRGLMGGVH